MLDLVLLRTFVSVVDTGNFTRAGEHLHLTQSTVSQQVIRLEQNLGCRLLDRSQRQVCRPRKVSVCLATRGACCGSRTRPARPSARPMATACCASACRKTSPAKC